ncbi:nitroreductase [Peribacillus cavernae]|uniref:Nitroreductase n=1 Tax=Peribacillus cavernae TaxID=1674310 RepID=A0A3S0WD05_9BACI|nr:nitroreductase family protein [Peribacillus cavernae]MDQ0218046.1 nitroreductase [Peribacillus cavernae]RUQ32793.1 nitroreductase [Peribacillus cavernae]
MDVFEAIRKRREITHYLDKSIPDEDLERILDSAYLAPSGNNLPSREFILVTKRESLQHLAQSTPFVPWLAKAAAAIVVTGRPEESKYWLQDASIACGFIWLSAVELGLGAAFGAIYHAEDANESAQREGYVRETLTIPNDRRVVAILGLGYLEKEPAAKQLLPKESLIHYEQFQEK